MNKVPLIRNGYGNEFDFIFTTYSLKDIDLAHAKYMIFYRKEKDYIAYTYVPYKKFYSKNYRLVIKNKNKKGKTVTFTFSKSWLLSRHISYRNSYRSFRYIKDHKGKAKEI